MAAFKIEMLWLKRKFIRLQPIVIVIGKGVQKLINDKCPISF